MKEEKKKLDALTKIKIVFTIEYLVIAFVVITIGVLKLTNVMASRQPRLLIYNIITVLGSLFILYSSIRMLVDKKYRQKVEVLDKLLLLPLPLYLIPFDIYCFLHYGTFNTDYIKYSISSVLLYIGVVYIFLGIYHFFKPSKEILEALKEEEEKELLEKTEDKKEDNTDAK